MALVVLSLLYRQIFSEPPVPEASFNGRTVVITGANSGLGLEASRWMVRLGAQRVILACRSVEKGEAAAKDIQSSTKCSPDTLEVWQLDMNSHASVQAFADKVRTTLPRVDAVLANAGVWSFQFRLAEGNEETINCNVVSTVLLGFLLLPKLRETAKLYDMPTYFTITGSDLYALARFKESRATPGRLFATLNDKEKSDLSDRYNVSKLLTLLMTRQMAEIYPLETNQVIFNSVGPGYCQSNLVREADYPRIVQKVMAIMARKTEIGARILVGGVSAGRDSHGEYMPDCKITAPGALAKGKKGRAIQERVWIELREMLEAIRPGVTSL